MDIQDKILVAVVDTQVDVKELKDRVVNIEDVQTRTCDKLDGFFDSY
ncbi:MAG: hypothetical protein ABIA47_00100 [bacterium]